MMFPVFFMSIYVAIIYLYHMDTSWYDKRIRGEKEPFALFGLYD